MSVKSHLVRTLELFLVKIKVSTQSPDSEERAQERRFVSCQGGAAGVFLVLGLEFCQRSYTMTQTQSVT